MNQSIQTLVIGLAIVTGSIGLLLTTTPPLQHQTAYASIDPETGNNVNEEEQSEEEGRFEEKQTPDGTMITDKKDGSCAHANPTSGNIYPCDPPGSLGHGGGVNVQ